MHGYRGKAQLCRLGSNGQQLADERSGDDMGKQHARTTAWLNRGLGIGSVGLGLAMIIAPARISRMCGVHRHPIASRVILPVLGIRQLGHAAGLLPARRPTMWIWSRVVGDAMDLSLLGRAMNDRRSDQRRLAMASGVFAAITAADVFLAIRTTRIRRGWRGPLHLQASITVNRPPEEVYRFWRDLENLPSFMHHLEAVRTTGLRSSHWTAKAPGGSVEWEAEILEDRPQELISWRTVDRSDIPNSGTVRFTPAPGGRGTEVRVELRFSPPGGRVGAAVATMFGEHPYQQVRDDLRRFKQVIETGEVARSEGTPEGINTRRQMMQHSGQPVMAGKGMR
jgi:uncharacterized membrane protein